MSLQSLIRLCAVCLFLGGALSARADRMNDLLAIHLEAMGGKARIDALVSLRAAGLVYAGGKVVRFTMTAARPAKVRLETVRDGRTLVQATDGAEAPWEFDSGVIPAKHRTMSDTVARTFLADAEFDDPLVGGASRGYVFDFAGELTVEGRKLLRVLVTHKMIETFSLLVDDETFLITKRVEQRTTTGGRKLQVVTHYEDFRPVVGVLLPHKITVSVDGNISQQTRIDRIDANPAVGADVFSRPKIAVPGLQPP